MDIRYCLNCEEDRSRDDFLCPVCMSVLVDIDPNDLPTKEVVTHGEEEGIKGREGLQVTETISEIPVSVQELPTTTGIANIVPVDTRKTVVIKKRKGWPKGKARGKRGG